MTTPLRPLAALGLAIAAVAFVGCRNPDAPAASSNTTSAPQNAGEPPAPRPPAPGAQAPVDVQPTPSEAISAFAELYTNWSYRTLVEHQHALAAMSVGAARLSERQAAASSQKDSTIALGHIENRGQILTIAREDTRPQAWVIVTREQTLGSSQYEGLSASYHVTIAQLATVTGGYAVEQWLPQT